MTIPANRHAVKTLKTIEAKKRLGFYVAPMMGYTDRHCRFFHRTLSKKAHLYTEMITANAVIYGDRDRLLAFDPSERPLILQLGGSDPGALAKACKIAATYGYDEINLNCGCPSPRVQSGQFGAALMHAPQKVAACIKAMQDASAVPITLKCRLGIDNDIIEQTLPHFLESVQKTGLNAVIIHARKAWLDGLSPKENRMKPPLNYALVQEMQQKFPHLYIILNGGITTFPEAKALLLEKGFSGVMIGRAAYHRPAELLRLVDREIFAQPSPAPTFGDIIATMTAYLERHLSAGGKAHQVTRHMSGLFANHPGARAWRHALSNPTPSRIEDAENILMNGLKDWQDRQSSEPPTLGSPVIS